MKISLFLTFIVLITPILSQSRGEYNERRKAMKEAREKRDREDHEDSKLEEGEKKVDDDDHAERDNELIHNPDNHEMFTRESFMAEYNQEKPTHPEVSTAKRFFPNKDSTINKERYKSLLKMFVDGTVHDEQIDEEIQAEAHKQLEEFVEEYIDSQGDKEEYTLEDLIRDFVEGKFHDWIDHEHPETDPDIEPDL